MPKFADLDMEEAKRSFQGFHFTNIRVEKLGATEYTAVTIVLDKTGSVMSFKKDLEEMLKTVAESCKKSPRALNLLIRVIAFNSHEIEEIHGWSLVNSINIDDYTDTVFPQGATNLYDATLNGIDVLHTYLVNLYNDQRICNANGIVFIITDGDDNDSRKGTPQIIRETIQKINQEEVIESIQTILIGVNDRDTRLKSRLETFRNEAKIDEYISVGDVTPNKLAKLAQFISQSISSQSSALGTGQSSQPIKDFTF